MKIVFSKPVDTNKDLNCVQEILSNIFHPTIKAYPIDGCTFGIANYKGVNPDCLVSLLEEKGYDCYIRGWGTKKEFAHK